jgi:sporulation protein YlmC with PRC-barrel domain
MAEIEIHRDDRVLTADGMEIGNVKHVIVDGPTRQVTEIVVGRDGEEWLVPMSGIMRSGDGDLTLQASRADFAGTALFDRHRYHAVDEDELDARRHDAGAGRG